MPRIHVPTLPWEEQHSPARKFHSYCRNLSVALGGIRNGGLWCGGHPFDLQIRRIPAGAAICPFHSHLAQWELFLVLAGTGRVRAGEDVRDVVAGEVFVHPPGEPHQLANPGPGDLEVLIVADNPELDAFYYPDSGKWGLRPPGKYFRMQETGYLDGEEEAPPGAPPYRPASAPLPAPPSAFSQRCRRLDDLPWEEWQSPRGKFRAASREVSVALGAVRNAPTGRGGHPFDLEQVKVPPGGIVCPFHSHAAQWECYLILTGPAEARDAAASHLLGPGDMILHPPGEPHQIRNPSASEALEFLLVADNPAVDYWHYPDSGKWGLRAPRKFFRLQEADYWDGEE
ncbi:MAG: cupin domain-containing protein [Verrucomicrobia bacterium]|nr:cupin domain-containing protein [Verrucomicrobiota bacterium]